MPTCRRRDIFGLAALMRCAAALMASIHMICRLELALFYARAYFGQQQFRGIDVCRFDYYQLLERYAITQYYASFIVTTTL